MTFMVDTGLTVTWISVAERKKCNLVNNGYCGSFDTKSSKTYRKTKQQESIFYADKEVLGI